MCQYQLKFIFITIVTPLFPEGLSPNSCSALTNTYNIQLLMRKMIGNEKYSRLQIIITKYPILEAVRF
jgi:hypothetical protein